MNLLAALLLFAATPARAAADDPLLWITLEADVQVQGAVVRFSDVAALRSLDRRLAARVERIELGRFEMGRERLVLERETLRNVLAENGLRGDGIVLRGADRVIVRPITQEISPDRLLRLCEAHVRAMLGDRAIDSMRSAGGIRPLTVPSGRFQLDLEVLGDAANPHYAGRVNLEVLVKVDGRTVERVAVPMQIDRRGQIVVAARRVARGRQLAIDDLELQDADLGRHGAGALLRVEDALGQTARVDLARGQIISSGHLRAQPVVRRDDIVTARVRVGRLEVKALCRALADGAPGDRIALENLDSKKKIYADVIDSKTVEAILQP